jgi:2-polyprenyl-3-methyl-5-hydroxy-6-metoxy-1,4-benzoquinol methylase
LIDKFIVTDIESSVLNLPESYFDVIILADVLEHFVDPWTAIDKISIHLKKDGILLVSLPNIREIATLFKIFFEEILNIILKEEFWIKPTCVFFVKKICWLFSTKKNISKLSTTAPVF